MKLFESQYNEVKSSLTEYLDLRVKYLKLQGVDILSKYLSSVLYILVFLIIILLTLVFLSIGVALYLNEIMESTNNGFLIVAAFYVSAIILMILFRKYIAKTLIRNKIITELMEITKNPNHGRN